LKSGGGPPHSKTLARVIERNAVRELKSWFRIKTMKTIIAFIAICLMAAVAKAADIEAAPLFQIRLVAETPTTTSEPMVMLLKSGDQTMTNTLNVEKAVLMDQKELKSARVSKNSFGSPIIDITFTKQGAEQFANVTEQNLHKRLAIVLDGHLTSAPTIQSRIPGGKAEISGSFNKEEAVDLANKINAAAKK
jgi:preprotein translocase subunit SecD